jgi:hypothetical protein
MSQLDDSFIESQHKKSLQDSGESGQRALANLPEQKVKNLDTGVTYNINKSKTLTTPINFNYIEDFDDLPDVSEKPDTPPKKKPSTIEATTESLLNAADSAFETYKKIPGAFEEVGKEFGKAVAGATVKTSESINAFMGLDWEDFPGAGNIDPKSYTPTTMLGGITKDILTFAGGSGVALKTLNAIKTLNYQSRIKTTADGISEIMIATSGGILALGAEQENIGDMLSEFQKEGVSLPIAHTLVDAMVWAIAKDPDDSTFDKTMKNLLGGAVEDAAIIPIIGAIKHFRNWYKSEDKISEVEIPPETSNKVIDLDGGDLKPEDLFEAVVSEAPKVSESKERLRGLIEGGLIEDKGFIDLSLSQVDPKLQTMMYLRKYEQPDTPEFKNFYAGIAPSLVHEDGNLKMFSHFSRKKIDQFDHTKATKSQDIIDWFKSEGVTENLATKLTFDTSPINSPLNFSIQVEGTDFLDMEEVYGSNLHIGFLNIKESELIDIEDEWDLKDIRSIAKIFKERNLISELQLLDYSKFHFGYGDMRTWYAKKLGIEYDDLDIEKLPLDQVIKANDEHSHEYGQVYRRLFAEAGIKGIRHKYHHPEGRSSFAIAFPNSNTFKSIYNRFPSEDSKFALSIIPALTAGAFAADYANKEPQIVQASLLGNVVKSIRKRTKEAAETLTGNPERLEDLPRSRTIREDFNFDHMNTTKDMNDQMNEVSNFYKEQIKEANRGILTREVIQDLAEQLDWTEADIIKRQIGGTFNAEQMLASRQILISSLDKLTNFANTLAMGGTNEDRVAFFKQLNLHALLQAQVKGAQTEIARSLGQFNITASGMAREIELEELLRDIDRHGDASTIARRFLELPTDRARNNMARNAVKPGSTDMAFEIWINALLSNPATHATNILSNALFTVWSIPEHVLAATIGAARSSITGSHDRLRIQEVLAGIRGMNRGTKEGFAFAWEAFKADKVHTRFNKLDGLQTQKITAANFGFDENSIAARGIDFLGHFVRLPGRFLMAEDDFFKALNYRIEIERLATRKSLNSIQDGMDPEEANSMYRNIIENGDSELTAQAVAHAREMTFTKDLGSFGKWLDQGRFKFPLLRLFMPFLRAPSNLIKEAFARSGVGILMPSVQKDLAAGGARRDLAISKIGLGSLVSYQALQWSAEDKITGAGPLNPNLRKSMEASGWRAHSFVFDEGALSEESILKLEAQGIKIGSYEGKTYVSYERMEPFATLLGVVADSADFIKYSDNDEAAEDVALHAMSAVLHNVGSKAWMEGVSLMMKAFDEPDKFVQNYLKGLVASTVPAAVGAARRVRDPYKKETRVDPYLDQNTLLEKPDAVQAFESVLKGWKDRWASESVNQLDNWGNPKKYGKGKWYEMVSPFKISKGTHQAIDKELIHLGYPMTLPNREIEGIKLSPEQYNTYVKLMHKEVDRDGLNLRQKLNELVQKPMYLRLSDAHRIEYIKKVKNQFQSVAASRLMSSELRNAKIHLDKMEQIDQDEAEEKQNKTLGLDPNTIEMIKKLNMEVQP